MQDALYNNGGARRNAVMRGFLFGQCGNLFKFSLWWISLAPLVFSLTGRTSSIGVTRIIYNAAICVLSPFGALLAERVPPRRLLLAAAAVRFVIWALICPGLGVLSFEERRRTDITDTIGNVNYGILCACMIFDGIAVACSVLLDVDVCGVDLLAGYLGIEVSDDDRNYYNSRSEWFFSLCFVVLAPSMAWLGLLYRHAISSDPNADDGTDNGTEALVLSLIFASTFAIGTIVQVIFFAKIPPRSAAEREALGASPTDALGKPLMLDDVGGDINGSGAATASGANGGGPPAAQGGLSETITSVLADVWETVGLLRQHPAVLARIIFLGLEMAVEDSVIIVVVAHCGLALPWMGAADAVEGNIWSAMIVATGKVGALLASTIMMRFYQPPDNLRGFRSMFFLVAVASVMSIGFVLAVDLRERGVLHDGGARVLFFVTSFLFFFFSTMPKVGFMSLLQAMVARIENGHRVFGFIAIVAMVCDAAMVMALSAVFEHVSLTSALYAAVGTFLAHGAFEALFGPWLVLSGEGGGADGNREGGGAYGQYVPGNDLGDEFDRQSSMASMRNIHGSLGATYDEDPSSSSPSHKQQRSNNGGINDSGEVLRSFHHQQAEDDERRSQHRHLTGSSTNDRLSDDDHDDDVFYTEAEGYPPVKGGAGSRSSVGVTAPSRSLLQDE